MTNSAEYNDAHRELSASMQNFVIRLTSVNGVVDYLGWDGRTRSRRQAKQFWTRDSARETADRHYFGGDRVEIIETK